MATAQSRAVGIRERNRADLTAAILATAGEQLASQGASSLSLRAVARELGMSSSAVYRYFPSRDDLLTRLIIEAYDSLGDFAERAEREVPRADLRGRFRAVGRAVREWALAHEHEYALIYGTPVPGYRAPQDTVVAAVRVANLLIGILVSAVEAGIDTTGWPPPAPAVRRAVAPAREAADASGVAVPPELVVRGLIVWSALFGAVSFELFGQFHNVVTAERAAANPFYDAELDRLADLVALPADAAATCKRGRYSRQQRQRL